MSVYAIIESLGEFGTIDEATKEALAAYIKPIHAAKGEAILEQGRVCRKVYFIYRGYVRGFYYNDGKDITAWFSGENDIAVAMHSFISQKPSIETIQALEDSHLYALAYDDLQRIYAEYPQFNLVGRLIVERYYIELEERTFAFQHQSAKARYDGLLQSYPQLLQRASLGQIASYLGISPETLSRIRGKK